MTQEQYNSLSRKIIGAAIEVHKEIGPGLLEDIYEHCLMEELKSQNIRAVQQVRIPLFYKGKKLSKDFFLDILVEDVVIVELKCVEKLIPVHEVQLVTYLKLADKRLGLLINFNVPVLVQGVKRKVNNF